MDPIYQFGGDLLLLQLPSGEFLFFCRRLILDYPPLLQNGRCREGRFHSALGIKAISFPNFDGRPLPRHILLKTF